MGLTMALLGFALVNVAMVHYFVTIANENVPESIGPHGSAFAVGGVLGVGGMLLAPGAATFGFGGMAVFFAVFLLWLLGQRRTPDGELIAKIGEVLPELAAPNQNGDMVSLDDLRGRRVLLKFYRGHW